MTTPLNFTYVDNSNVFVEGSRASAVAKKLPGAETYIAAMNNHVTDKTWQPDYGKLHAFVCGDKSEIGCAKLWGSPRVIALEWHSPSETS